MRKLLKRTVLLDYGNPEIQNLIVKKGWKDQSPYEKILHTYTFVRDEIRFGYNSRDALPASRTLREGYGQCNTKGILLMALLRTLGIPCRLHGFTIDKRLQRGAIKGLWYRLTPREILHSWVEVYHKEQWLNLEGYILDGAYLTGLQRKFKDHKGSFCGYGMASPDFRNPPVEWDNNNTYIQKEGILRDLGVYDDPDAFFFQKSQGLNPVKQCIFQSVVRNSMNRNVQKIRE